MDEILKASLFAEAAHAAVGQRRKYTHEPYIEHPRAVANLVMKHACAYIPEMIEAALLHDVVEDTHITLEQIRRIFGSLVAMYVGCLTDAPMPGVNRADRQAAARIRLAAAPREAQTIKLADLIDNAGSIFQHDPKFARVYLEEKRQLLLVMTKGDETLTKMAWQIVKQGQEKLRSME